MRRFSILLSMVALLVVSAAPAFAMRWSVGANLGLSVFSPSEDADPGVTTIAWPGSGMMPGMRVGFAGENPQHEFFIDTALDLTSIEDVVSTRDFIVTGNYQYNFPSQSNLGFYVTGGAGFDLIGAKDESPGGTAEISATSAIFGGGVGLRHKMGNGHGTMRAEVRYDRISEGEDSGVIVIPEGGAFGVKLGFDLWD
jgi:hypothetical protein